MTRKSLITISFLSWSWLLTAGLTGCEGEQGPAGVAGANVQAPPVINSIIAIPDSVGFGERTTLFVFATDPNGDTITYSWSAAAGTLTETNTSVVSWTSPDEQGHYQVTVTVFDNDGSAEGHVTIGVLGVNDYGPTAFPSFLGENAARCSHCHGQKVEGWLNTNHAEAYETLAGIGQQENPYCLQCHTTGFDDVYDLSGNLLSIGLDNGGYDDNPVEGLRGVQCEACHDPVGPVIMEHTPSTADALHGERCGQCHDQYEEYSESGHGTAIENAGGYDLWRAERNLASCAGCHISEGFLAMYDADWATYGLQENLNQVTCATCHDVHAEQADDNPFYLRGLQAVLTPYGGSENPAGREITGWGFGQLCGQCHHARNSESEILSQIDNGSANPGPHGSAQADMLSGYGSYEIPGYQYDREANHNPDMLGNMCVDCHMLKIPGDQPGGPYFGHGFEPDARKCAECHTGAVSINIGGVQTGIEELLTQLFAFLPNDGSELLPYDTGNWTREQREAGYAYFFVSKDGSRGVHNQAYTRSLLNNAILYLSQDAINPSARD